MHSSLKVYIYHVTLEFIVILVFFIWFWVLDESVAFIFFPAAENLHQGRSRCKSQKNQ